MVANLDWVHVAASLRVDLLWHEPQPSREVASLREHVAASNGGDNRARDDGADPRHAHEAVAARILSGNRFDLAREVLDALVERPPIAGEVFDDAQHARCAHRLRCSNRLTAASEI